MKRWSISTRIAVILTIVLLIGLGSISVVTAINTQMHMTKAATTRMEETVRVRSKIVENYIAEAEIFLKGYAQANEVKETLMDASEENVSRMRNFTFQYASVNKRLENIYLADENSLLLVSVVEVLVGKNLREGEKLKQLTTPLFSSKEVYNVGVMTSPSTGSQVLSMYYPVYDDAGQPIGFAGMALQANELLDTLNELQFVGLNDCSYYLLDASKKNYISGKDSEKNGTPIEDENLLSILDGAAAITDDTVGRKDYKETESGNGKVAIYRTIPNRGWVFVVEVSKSELQESTDFLVTTLICMSVIVLAICLVFINLVSRMSLKGIREVGTVIAETGKLDISQGEKLKKHMKRGDETGIIANATYDLTQELIKVTNELREQSDRLLHTSVDLKSVFDTNIESVEQVEHAIQDIANGAGNQAEETQNASEQVIKIGAMVDDLSKETVNLHDNSTFMNQISDEAMSSLQYLREINDKTEDSAQIIYQQTANTNTSVNKIQNAVSIITAIAEETSLLSLNASIEAARAGEQGRGFSVVATQIKKLAEQSNESATVINEIITSLIQDSQNAVHTMEEVQENVKLQSEHVDKTTQVFQQLKERIDQSIEWVNSISSQAEIMNEARLKVVDVVSNLSAIAEENAASSEETSASVSIVNENMQAIKTSADQLEEMAGKLEKTISKFKLS